MKQRQNKTLLFHQKSLREKNEVKAYINNFDKAMLISNIFKINKTFTSYQIFTIHSKDKKMMNQYLLQWVQAWQRRIFRSTLNKQQAKNPKEVYIIRISSGQVSRAFRAKKASEVEFALVAIYKKCGVFKYLKVFQGDNASEFNSYVTKLL